MELKLMKSPPVAPVLANPVNEQSVLQSLLVIALPIMVSNLLQSVLEVVDLYFVGRLGAEAIAGVSMSLVLIITLMTVVIGLNTATMAFIARAYGAREYDRVGGILVHSMIAGAFFALMLAGIGYFFANDIIVALGATPTVASFGGRYLSVFLLGIGSMIELWILSSAFQSVGNARTPMIVMVIVNIINIVLNPLLIFGAGPVPAFGVVGSALATVGSRSLGLILLIYVVLGGKTPLTFSRSNRFDPSFLVRLFRVAIPNSVQSGMRSLSFILLMSVVAIFGSSAVSAYGIAIRLEFIALMPGFAIATAAAVLVGQNIGACRLDRAESGVRYALLLYGGIMAVTACVYFFFAEGLIGFFDPSGVSTVIGAGYLHTITPFYLLNAVAIILSFAMNGAGATTYPMFATTVALILVQIPLAIILPGLLGAGIVGVWIAIVIAIIVQFGLLGYLYQRGSWKKVCL